MPDMQVFNLENPYLPQYDTDWFCNRYRRVKCDQDWPACRRCSRTGRRCDGYEMPNNERLTPRYMSVEHFRETICSPLTSSLVPHPFSTRRPQELRSIQFFQTRTMPAMSGCFGGYAWYSLAINFGTACPAILHAIIALGAYHEMSEAIKSTEAWSLDRSANPSALSSLASVQYMKAIPLLRNSLSSNESSPAGIEIACVLFACIESLRGNRQSASVHVTGGLSVIKSRQKRQLIASEEAIMKPVFARMSLMQSLYGRPRGIRFPELLDPYDETPSLLEGRFVNLKDAYTASTGMLNGNVRYVEMTKHGSFPDQATTDIAYAAHLSKVEDWSKAFEAYASEPPTSEEEVLGRVLLRAHHSLAVSFLAACRTRQETSFDLGISHFELIVRSLEPFILGLANSGQPFSTSFSLDMGLVPTLFYTAIKCRHPKVRRRAIALLRLAPRREGLWDAIEAAKVAELVVKFEETYLDESGKRDSSTEPSLVPEWARILDVDILGIDSLDPSRQLVILRWKPDGIDGKVLDMRSYIRW